MACFIVPAAEAIVVKVVEKHTENREKELIEKNGGEKAENTKIPFSAKLRWLTWMLVGGVVLLAFEHIWHGEVTPWFPFLTAMGDPNDAMEMLREMSTVGVTMAILITAIWGVMCVVADHIVRRAPKTAA